MIERKLGAATRNAYGTVHPNVVLALEKYSIIKRQAGRIQEAESMESRAAQIHRS